ncbi:MAG TPA: DUF4244 domain-containing protein [Mycobacteriales bacterium]|nr:DUF4244 domain-containing protein [Mycobacteriales bacterium]
MRLFRQLPGIRALLAAGEEGMSTAEYAVGTVAACGFAALLYKILTSDSVLHLVTDIISRALHLGF